MFVCEVSDDGPGIEGHFPGYAGDGRAGLGGLAVARQVCDAVEVRSTPSGTTVRLHLRLA
jgi:hypothetical protein